jgi:serine/threonine protein phosphatase PrpC
MKAIHSLLLLATENPQKGSFRLERLAPGVVAAATAGDGSPTNPKITPNEDSLAVVELPTGTAALIADAHFGPSAGEIVVRGFAQAMERTLVSEPQALGELMAELDRRIKAERPPRDRSETTALAVFLGPRTLAWASVGDSLLYIAAPGRPLTRVTRGSVEFLSGDLVLENPNPAAAGAPVLETGSLTLPSGAVALMASDGILPDYSGMSEARLNQLLLAPGPLEERVSAVMSEAGSAQHGGGRDNLSVIAMTREP